MGLLLIAIFVGVPGWIAFWTVCTFHRQNARSVWWVVFCAFLLTGTITGFWTGFFLEYHVNATLRFAGFPFSMAIFQLESGTWVDYVHDTPIMVLIGIADVLVVALCFVIPVSAAFCLCRFLKRKSVVGAWEEVRTSGHMSLELRLFRAILSEFLNRRLLHPHTCL